MDGFFTHALGESGQRQPVCPAAYDEQVEVALGYLALHVVESLKPIGETRLLACYRLHGLYHLKVEVRKYVLVCEQLPAVVFILRHYRLLERMHHKHALALEHFRPWPLGKEWVEAFELHHPATGRERQELLTIREAPAHVHRGNVAEVQLGKALKQVQIPFWKETRIHTQVIRKPWIIPKRQARIVCDEVNAFLEIGFLSMHRQVIHQDSLLRGSYPPNEARPVGTEQVGKQRVCAFPLIIPWPRIAREVGAGNCAVNFPHGL